MPLAFYDFELSTDRVTFSNVVKAAVNSGATPFNFQNCTMAGVDGAGAYNGGSVAGQALAFYKGSNVFIDPKGNADSYVQFKINASSFTGIGVTFQVLANHVNSPFYGISISTDNSTWNWVASTTTPGTNILPLLNVWSVAVCRFPAIADNASNLYVRIYNYNTVNSAFNSHIRFDNIEITAAATLPGTVKTMLDDRLIFTSKTSGNNPLINSIATITRNNFVVTGSGTAISIPYLDLVGRGITGGNLTISNNATLTLGSTENTLYVDSAKGVIPASAINILSGGTLILEKTLDVQGTLNINYGTLNLNGQKLILGGTLSRTNAVINAASGTLELNSKRAIQPIAGSFFAGNKLENLVNSNRYGINISAFANDTLKIIGKVSFGAVNNSVITTGNNLTLLSTATATASVGDLTNNGVNSGNNVTGKVNVERYISNAGKWRLLAVPTNTNQTFKQSWQENAATAGGNPMPGYGVIIGDNRSASYIANGFDQFTPGGPTVKTFNGNTGSWVGVNSTNSLIKTNGAYMTYIRSNRSGVLSATTMRTSGDIYTGTQPVITVAANQFATIGNPYPSAIDLRKVVKTGVQDAFYVWDPKAGGGYGLGAYQSFVKIGSDYKVFPGGGSYGAQLSVANIIESGQAFFVKADAMGGSLQLSENSKVGGSMLVFREVNPDNPMLRATLYSVTTDSSTLLDGAMVNFDSAFSDNIDEDDILKMTNGSENVSIKKNAILMLAERRSGLAAKDTVQLNLTGVRVQSYKWSITADRLELNGKTAFLNDAYTNTVTPLNLNGVTNYSFNIVNIPNSYAANRFTIVFAQPAVLPVSITSIAANRNSGRANQVTVNWKVENEINIEKYDVEYSTNGLVFESFTSLAAALIGTNVGYTAQHNDATTADNFYRIKAISSGGQVQYSAIVKVASLKTAAVQAISVYPNPVVDKIMNVQFQNQPSGIYSIKMFSQAGAAVYQNTLTITGNNQVKAMKLQNTITAGNYQMVVTSQAGKQLVSQVVVL